MLIATLIFIVFYLIMLCITIFYFFNRTDTTCLKCFRGILPIIIWILFLACEILTIVANTEYQDKIDFLNELNSLSGCIPETYVYQPSEKIDKA